MEKLAIFFFKDKTTGEVSTTKLWSNVAYVIMLAAYIYSVVTGTPLDMESMAAFATAFVGNRTVLKIANIAKATYEVKTQSNIKE